MTAAELFEIVTGTEEVWGGHLAFRPERPTYYAFWTLTGECDPLLERDADFVESHILGCLVKWLGERGCMPDSHKPPYEGGGYLWGVWRNPCGFVGNTQHPTQRAACAEAVRVLLREESR